MPVSNLYIHLNLWMCESECRRTILSIAPKFLKLKMQKDGLGEEGRKKFKFITHCDDFIENSHVVVH